MGFQRVGAFGFLGAGVTGFPEGIREERWHLLMSFESRVRVAGIAFAGWPGVGQVCGRMFELLQFEFARHALYAALILGPACALLGVLVVLRGQSFFSDALAHSAVSGVALGLLLQQATGGWPQDVTLAVLPFIVLLAMGITLLQQKTLLRSDAVITFSFAGSLALGLVVLTLLDRYTLIDGILFGNIYALQPRDLVVQGVLAAVIVGVVLGLRRQFMLALVQPELAKLQGVRTDWLHYLLAFVMALTVSVCVKMFGALLLGALIVIPASAARLVAGSFAGLLAVAAGIGLVVPATGVLVSLGVNLPTAPVVVLSLLVMLAACLASGAFLRRRLAG